MAHIETTNTNAGLSDMESNEAGIGNYYNLDVRLGWHPVKNMEFSLIGHNLLQAHYPEAVPDLINTQQSQLQRGFYGMLTWRF